MNIARAIMIASFGDNEEGTNIGTIVYFSMAVLITMITIWL